jgi:hypothetical protein
MNKVIVAVVQAGSCLVDTQRTLDKAGNYCQHILAIGTDSFYPAAGACSSSFTKL